MGLDWFTLIAQVVNFLVLVWLLRHFLYARIVRAMNEREAKIASRLEAAAQQRAEAEREAGLLRARNRELDARRDELLAGLDEEAEAHRERQMEAIRLEMEAAQAEWLESLQRERQAMLRDLRERLVQQVIALSRHALKELADADLEGQILRAFVGRLRGLDPAERGPLVAALRDPDREVELRTAFPVPPEAREDLSRSLSHQLDGRVDVRFTTDPELICGVELRAQSHRFAWNLDSYLSGLEARVFGVLEERAKADAKPS